MPAVPAFSLYGVTAAAAGDGQHGVFLLIVFLVEKHDQVVGGFQRNTRFMAQFGKKGDVALFALLHAGIGWVFRCEEHTSHSAD